MMAGKVFGDAYIYYDNLTPTEKYWVVGASVGSTDANLGVASKAATPDKVRPFVVVHSMPHV